MSSVRIPSLRAQASSRRVPERDMMEVVPTGIAIAATGALLLIVGLPRTPQPTPPAPAPAPVVTVMLADTPPEAPPAVQLQPAPPEQTDQPPPPPPAANVPTIPIQAPRPKVVRPHPHPHEEPKPAVAPRPPQPVPQVPPAPATPQVSQPAPKATPEVSQPAAPAGSPSVEGLYVGRLRGYIRTLTRYPSSMEARMEHLQGKVMVQFVLSRAGEISDVNVVVSSGSPVLDQAAVSEVRGGNYGALPIPAQAWPGEPSHAFQVQMTFTAPE